MPQDIDPKVKTLVTAIGQTETGRNNPNAYSLRGKSGEYGRYQFMPSTWDSYSKAAGVNTPLESASVADQNKVAYHKIKSLKDQGYNPAQIASMWNAGEARPDAYKQGWKGVNSQGVAYDTPAYAKKVSEAYMRLNSEQNVLGGQKQVPQAQPEGPQTLGQDLGGIVDKRLAGADEAIAKKMAGEQGLTSTAIQVGGQAAGGILDVLGAGLKHTPIVGGIVQSAEDLLGGAAKAVIDTPMGQSGVQAYQNFAEEHPEATANIGAGVNIASAIPVVRGVAGAFKAPGLIKDAIRPGAVNTTAVKELEQTIERRAGGGQILANAKKKGLDPVTVIVGEKAVPEIVKDAKGVSRYSTKTAEAKLVKTINNLDNHLDSILAKGKALGGYVGMDSLRDGVIAEIKKTFKGSPDLRNYVKKVESDFENFVDSYGDKLTLEELNQVKRQVRKSVKFDTPSMDKDVRYHEGQAFMKVIEDVAEKHGLGDVKRINKEMANRIEAQRLLSKYVNGKSVAEHPTWSKFGGWQEGAMVAGAEAIGQAAGAPLVGAIGAKTVSNMLRKPKATAIEKLNQKPTRGLLGTRGLRTAATVQGTQRGYQEQTR